MKSLFVYPNIQIDFPQKSPVAREFDSTIKLSLNHASLPVFDKLGNLRFLVKNPEIDNAALEPMKGFWDPDDPINAFPVSVVPDPINPDMYYIFSLKYKDGTDPLIIDLVYHIVNAAGDNGKGELIKRNITLDRQISPTMVAIQHASKPGCHWIITQKEYTDSFHVFLLDEKGIASTPKIMKAGWESNGGRVRYTDMAFSPDGKMISATSRLYKPLIDGINIGRLANQYIALFNFDAESGTITPRVQTYLQIDYQSRTSTIFSPDSRLLYATNSFVSQGLQPVDIGGGSLFVFNTCFTDSTNFSTYVSRVADFSQAGLTPFWGPHVHASNKKFYSVILSEWHTGLASVEFPNRWGTSSLTNIGKHPVSFRLGMGHNLSVFNHMSIENVISKNITYSGGCFPNPYQFRISGKYAGAVSWNFGDTTSGVNNYSSLQIPSHSFSRPGTYQVTAILHDAFSGQPDTLQELIEIKDPKERLLKGFPNDTSICANEPFVLYATGINHIFKWRYRFKNGSVSDQYTRFAKDTITLDNITDTVTVLVESLQSDCESCRMYDSVRIRVKPKPYLNLGKLRTICLGDSTLLFTENNGARTIWNNGDTTASLWVKKAGIYYVTQEYDNNGCIASDTVEVRTPDTELKIDLGKDTTLCGITPFLLRSPFRSPRYTSIWNNHTQADSLFITKSGTYTLSVYDYTFSCSSSDTINITYLGDNSQPLGSDTVLCNTTSFVLSSLMHGKNYKWSTGETTPAITINNSGIYSLAVDLESCHVTDSIQVQFENTPKLNLGADTTICPNASLSISGQFGFEKFNWNTGSVEQTILVTLPGEYILTGYSWGGCAASDTINISKWLTVPPSLGEDKIQCTGNPIELRATHPNATQYRWSNGAETSSTWVDSSGSYSVTVTDKNGCATSDTVQVKMIPLPVFKFQSQVSFCSGQNIRIQSPIAGDQYLWSTGSSDPVATFSTGGSKWLRITTNGCSATDTFTIREIASPLVNLGADTSICQNSSILLSTSESNVSYAWSTGQTTPTIRVSSPGKYSLTVRRESCVATDTISVGSIAVPKLLIGSRYEICKGEAITLKPTGVYQNLVWNSTIQSDSLTVKDAATITIQASNQCGNISKKVEVVTITCELYMPTAFTPNGDGLNDKFGIKYSSLISDFSFEIFDRWGNRIFYTTNPANQWDGSYRGIPMKSGAYAWKVSARFTGNEVRQLSGLVSLIR